MDKDTSCRSLKSVQKRMLLKKFLLLLFFISSTFSFLKLFTTTVKSPTPSPRPISQITTLHSYTNYTSPVDEEDDLTTKEVQLLSNLITQKSPCNLLFFGFRPQFLNLASLNSRGTTVFLEDDKDKLQRAQGARIYRVKYHEKANRAYELLRHSRKHFGCKLGAIQLLEETNCKLAQMRLPKEVKDRAWDVVVVDGPRGDGPEEPGRMEAIYMASVIAREGNASDVFVHDIDRMIERWYSWEFLCQENLVASRGKLWHFRVGGKTKLGSFCTGDKFQIL